jgi:DNA-binding NtrC family response regulator
LPKILIVDDEPGIRFGVRDFLESEGLEADEADSVASADKAVREGRPDAVILDHMLPDGTALDLLPRLKEFDPALPVVVLTGHASIDLAVRAVKEGADQFLAKPVELPALLVLLRRLLESQRERRRQIAGRTRQAREEIDPFVGTSAPLRQLAEDARRVCASSSPILIEGETGTGKGVLARWLHRNGLRADEPFVDLNCAGLSREFLETELFGHEKGAYTGAVTSKPGLLEVAHRGVFFLDEIGDLDPQVQPKVLKVLEEKRFRRLGEVRDRQVDVHLIAATHQDLAELAKEKKFRSDLYYRISTIPLRVPALRERPEDIPGLARRLLEGFSADWASTPGLETSGSSGTSWSGPCSCAAATSSRPTTSDSRDREWPPRTQRRPAPLSPSRSSSGSTSRAFSRASGAAWPRPRSASASPAAPSTRRSRSTASPSPARPDPSGIWSGRPCPIDARPPPGSRGATQMPCCQRVRNSGGGAVPPGGWHEPC